MSIVGNNKTRKKKKTKNMSDMWKQFDEDISNVHKKTIKCVFDSEKNDFCDECGTILYINDENFMTCSNTKCGKLFKDILNTSAEWRFYSANDSSGGSNPSRCGMPIKDRKSVV